MTVRHISSINTIMSEDKPFDSRFDTAKQAIVDRAIMTAHTESYQAAWKILDEANFHDADIYRILNDTERRRKYINDYLTGN
jgi:hypothetical protein